MQVHHFTPSGVSPQFLIPSSFNFLLSSFWFILFTVIERWTCGERRFLKRAGAVHTRRLMYGFFFRHSKSCFAFLSDTLDVVATAVGILGHRAGASIPPQIHLFFWSYLALARAKGFYFNKSLKNCSGVCPSLKASMKQCHSFFHRFGVDIE